MAVLRGVLTADGTKKQAIVRKGGFSLSRTFWRTRDAEDWARRCEDAIASATPEKPFDRKKWLMATPETVDDNKPHAGWSIDKALEHYGQTITPKKKGAIQELTKIGVLQKSSLKALRLDRATQDDVQIFVNGMVVSGKSGSTVLKYVYLLSALYRDARKVWKLQLSNPCIDLDLPRAAPPRKRRLEDGHDDGKGEEERIRAALATKPRGPEMLDLMDLAIELSMRQSEVLGITVGQFKRVGGTAILVQPDSKNGDPRNVPLSKLATTIIERHRKGKKDGQRLFTQTPADLRQRWRAALKTAGIEDLRWHDLRHEALSRMATDKGMHIGMLKIMSGHRTVKVLMDYVNPSDREVAKKLG